MRVLITTPTIDTLTYFKMLDRHPVRLDDINSRDQLIELAASPEYQAGFEWPNGALEFIKANVPSVETLDYPTMEEYEKVLAENRYDAVGFSFYTIGAPTVVKMAALARQYGVSKIWAGNFGASTPGMAHHFDKVFSGYGEEPLRQIIGEDPLPFRRHPTMTGYWGKLNRRKPVGFLYTITGCRFKCRFCCTVNFVPTPVQTPSEEIYRVIDEYYKLGIEQVMIMDETFLQNRDHSLGIMRKLQSRDMTWHCTSHLSLIKGRVKELYDYGMRTVYVGVESLDDISLKGYRKGQTLSVIRATFDELNENGIVTTLSYILAAERDTDESIRHSVDIIKNDLKPFCAVFLVLTPHVNAEMSHIEEKIFDRNPRHYDSMHLVWRHPHLEPDQVRDLLWHAHESVVHPGNYAKRKIVNRWRALNRHGEHCTSHPVCGQVEAGR